MNSYLLSYSYSFLETKYLYFEQVCCWLVVGAGVRRVELNWRRRRIPTCFEYNRIEMLWNVESLILFDCEFLDLGILGSLDPFHPPTQNQTIPQHSRFTYSFCTLFTVLRLSLAFSYFLSLSPTFSRFLFSYHNAMFQHRNMLHRFYRNLKYK